MMAKVKAKKKTTVPARTRKGRTTATRLSAKNQITLPVEIIRKAGFRVGDTINCTINKDGRIELSPLENPMLELVGIATGLYAGYDLRADRDAWDA